VLWLRGLICGGAPAFNFQLHGNSFGKRENMHFSNVLTSNHGNATTTKYREYHEISAL
jgi:hypothetical protein